MCVVIRGEGLPLTQEGQSVVETEDFRSFLMGGASPSSEQVEACRGGKGRAGNRKRSSSGSRQMSVNDYPHFLLGENEAQIMQLPRGCTAARWPSWVEGSWQEWRRRWEPVVLGRTPRPKETGSQMTSFFLRSHVSCAGLRV